MKNSFKMRAIAAYLAAILVFSPANPHPFEFRSGQPLSRGPLRTLVEEESNQWSVRCWSGAYFSDAQKAFTQKHGTSTQDIAALYFGKSDFRATEMFPNRYVPMASEFYNPLLRTARLQPSLRYNEAGVVIGGSCDIPTLCRCGRVGVRVSVPFKKVRLMKVDTEGVRMGQDTKDVFFVTRGGTSTTGVVNPSTERVLVRVDYAEAMAQSSSNQPALRLDKNSVKIGTNEVSFPSITTTQNDSSEYVALIYSPEGYLPNPSIRNVVAFDEALQTTSNPTGVTYKPSVKGSLSDLFTLSSNNFALFKNNVDYRPLAETEDRSLEERIAAQELKSNLWLTGILDSQGVDKASASNGAMGLLRVLNAGTNSNIYEWLHDNANLDFQTYTTEGAGDMSCELFWSQDFGPRINAEGVIGFKAPTGGKVGIDTNPFHTARGSGGHWQVFAGAKTQFIPSSCMVLRADFMYHFVLGHIENRFPAYSGTEIRIGRPVEADVKWEYLVANLDLNILHLWSKDVTALIGYQFYYKRRDKIAYNQKSAQTWLGNVGKVENNTIIWSPYLGDLDPVAASVNTNALCHKLKFEGSFVLSDWIEAFAGLTVDVAGRNTLRSSTIHLGFNVAF